MTRPNLVLFMPDQLRADAVGAFGNPVARTPNIDALAARGTTFTQAFSQNSVCAQSRASIFTGWYPHTAGHRTLTHLLKPWEPNLFKLLKDSGYHVAWAGLRGDMLSPGVTTASTDYANFAVLPKGLHWKPAVPPAPQFAETTSFYTGLRAPVEGDDVVLDFDEACVQTAEQLLGGGMPEPWVLFIALLFPHPPFVAEEPWFSMYDRADMPGPLPSRLDDKPQFMGEIRRRYGLARLDDKDWAELRAVYYGMVARVDAQLGRVVTAVDRAGASDRTAWAFFTDHGEYLGDYGLVEKWPTGLNDCLVRNPLVLSVPGQREGGRADALVEMVDLLPTLLELAEVEVAHSHFGKSLAPLLVDPGQSHRAAAFSEGGHRFDEPHALEERSPAPYDHKTAIQQDLPRSVGKAVCMRTADWTYTYRLYEGDELYDRGADPGELVNLAGRPEHADVERSLRDTILEWMVATADVVPFEKDPRFPSD